MPKIISCVIPTSFIPLSETPVLAPSGGSLRGQVPPKEAPIRLNGRPRAESRYLHAHHSSRFNECPHEPIAYLAFGSAPDASW